MLETSTPRAMVQANGFLPGLSLAPGPLRRADYFSVAMLKLGVKFDTTGFERKLQALKRDQVPYAAAMALNDVGDAVIDAEKREMRDVFDSPTPNTLNSLYMRRATKQRTVVVVGLKNFAGKQIPATKYLAAQIRGGERRLKRFEKALQSVGAMPSGMVAVPGAGAKIDAFGNMDGGQIVQILSYFKAFPEAGYKANMSDKRRKSLHRGNKRQPGISYFVGRPGGGYAGNSSNYPLGIWQRTHLNGGTAVRPVILFVDRVAYEQNFDFYYVARKTVERAFPSRFKARLAEAIRTGR